eukprot:m.38317 g.38317  ORF g.38317 m.38317 type:complete len:436 (+) comp17886_c0_seq1:211-1518(+)
MLTDMLTRRVVALAAGAVWVKWLWGNPKVWKQVPILRVEPGISPHDRNKFRAGVALLAAGLIPSVQSVYVVELALSAFFLYIKSGRFVYDWRSQAAFLVQNIVLFGSAYFGYPTAWWMLLFFGTFGSTMRRFGFPPLPILVGHCNLDDAFTPNAAKQCWNNTTGWKQIPLKNADGDNLMVGECVPFPDRDRWIVFFNGNAMLIEHNASELQILAHKLGANIVAFNYRGVGCSEGCPRNASDLVDDGTAVMDYLVQERSVDPSRILIMGISLGGCVGACVRAIPRFQHGPILVDRSFCDVFDVSIHFGYNIIDMLVRNSPSWRPVLVAALHWIAQFLILPMLEVCGWSMRGAEHLRKVKGTVIVTYHPLDGVLPVGCQTHEGVFKPVPQQQQHLIKLTKVFPGNPTKADPLYHQYMIHNDPAWESIARQINVAWTK